MLLGVAISIAAFDLAVNNAATKTRTAVFQPQPNGASGPVNTEDVTFRVTQCDLLFDTSLYVNLDSQYRCGWVHRSSKPEIRIPIVEFSSTSSDQTRSPIYHLHGGPGAGSVAQLADSYDFLIAPFIDKRDVVVFDQRGAGQARPNLHCNDDSTETHLVKRTPAENFKLTVACGRKWRDLGVDLSWFNVAASSDDVAAIAAALEHDQINLVGVSWGGRLAKEVMRRYPQLVRATVFDSGLDETSDLVNGMPATFAAALETIEAACQREACWPQDDGGDRTLQERLGDLVAMLRSHEIRWSPPTTDDSGAHERSFGPSELSDLLFAMLYSAQDAASIPDLIYDLEHRDMRLASRFLLDHGLLAPEYIDLTFASHMCNDLLQHATATPQFDDPDLSEFYRLVDDFPDGRGETAISLCSKLGFDPVALPPASAQSVAPDRIEVPALILAGSHDPIVSPHDSREMKDDFRVARFAQLDGAGHVIGDDYCARWIIDSFLDDPYVPIDTGCVVNSRFTPALAPLSPTLEDGELRYLSPELGWTELEFDHLSLSAYMPDGWWRQSEPEQTWLYRYAYPSDLTSLSVLHDRKKTRLRTLLQALGATKIPGHELAGGDATQNWNLDNYHSWFGLSVLAATHPKEDVVFVLIAYPEEITVLYENVLQPALAAGFADE